VSEQVIDRLGGLAAFLLPHFSQQEVESGFGHRRNRLANGGELGQTVVAVIVSSKPTTERSFAHRAAPVRDRDHGRGHIVVAGEDGGRRPLAIEQLFSGVETRAVTEKPLLYVGGLSVMPCDSSVVSKPAKRCALAVWFGWPLMKPMRL